MIDRDVARHRAIWTAQQRADAAAAREAQRHAAEFQAQVRAVRCFFPDDLVVERAPESRLSGRGGSGWLERLFGGWR